MKTMTATDFKARCLAVLDDVARTGEPVTILKRGKAVAQLRPPSFLAEGFPQDQLRGSVEVVGDILGPVLPADAWDVEKGR